MNTRYIFNAVQLGFIYLHGFLSHMMTSLSFWLAGVKHGSFSTSGIPFIHVSMKANFEIGKNFVMGNSILTAATGEKARCKFDVRGDACLKIGNNVGITQSSIHCANRITIGNDVKIGFGTNIIDTDFHSIDAEIRASKDNDVKTRPITIGDKVFIGAHCLILKGVTIGEGAIIGAGSVVSKDIPPYSVAVGNPAKVVKQLK